MRPPGAPIAPDLGRSTARLVDEFVSDVGSLAAWEVVPQIFVSRVTGHMQLGHAEAWLRIGNRILASGRPVAGFHDWFGMTSYDSATRAMLTDWSLANLASFHCVHIAIDSKLVRMGVTVANLALGGIMATHADSASLAAAYEACVRDFRKNGVPTPGR